MRLVVIRVVLLFILSVPFLPTIALAQPIEQAAECGVERWPVKTLADDDAGRVNLAPVATTITELRSLARPGALPARSRIAPVELTTYTMRADLIAAKREEDSDIHLVVAQPGAAEQTMIVEFPDAECMLTTAPALVERTRAARAAFIAAHGSPATDRFVTLSGTARITGVGFFDFIHGQRGVAPNGIELHPVLEFSPDATVAAEQTCFSETGMCMRGRFAAYWQAHGGLAQQGFPITDEFEEVNSATGRPIRVQYFERARFEHHPENAGTEYEVLLGLLGREQFSVRYPGGRPPGGGGPRCFGETNRCIVAHFADYWESHGGLAQQGFPISDSFDEVNAATGQSYVVQYFERARFEYHPENAGTAYEVLLGLLGREQFSAKYPGGQPPALPPLPDPVTPPPPVPAPPAPVPGKGVSPVNATTCPASHPIKGNITSSGEKIYHVPGGASYNVTKPEVCFATEADAQAAGFRRAAR